MIDTISRIVEDACKKESNFFGYGIWKYHIVYVVGYAKMLAEKAGADVEIVEIAALLHDYAGIKDHALSGDHHIHGAKEAEALLKTLDYPGERIERVKECILCHRGSVPREKSSVEARCVADADAMAHFATLPSLYYLAFTAHGLGVDEANAWVSAKLERSWAKLSAEGKSIIKDRYEAYHTLLAIP
jgi:uncharacterized protein